MAGIYQFSQVCSSGYSYSRIPLSGTAVSGRTPMSGGFPVRSDSFYRQDVQLLAGLSCKREIYALYLARLSKFDCI
jgi:hypothetical protein